MTRNKNSKKNSKDKKPSSTHGVLKLFLGLFTILIIGLIAFGAYSYYSLFKMGKNIEGNKDKEQIETAEVKKNDPINVLLMGVDIGDPKLKGDNVPKRTDTMLVIHYDPAEKSAQIVSVPRDTKVEINGRTEKINNAHAINGIKGAIDSVESLLDIDINYYVRLDYEGFRQVIDAIGGVDMPIERNMNYDDDAQNLHIHFEKGTVTHLDGKKAEEFFRWRKNNNGAGFADGDLGRIKNQHLFIEKVIDKVKSPSIVFKLKNILDITSKYVKTNMSPTEMLSYGMGVTKVDKANINMTTLQGDGKYISKISYFIYDENKNLEVLKILRGSKPMSIDIESLKIKVINGTSKSGLASNFKEYINKKGYGSVEVGNGEKSTESKIIFHKEIDDDSIRSIKREFKIDNVDKNMDSQDDCDVTVILGEDHEYIK
ncbi:LCP family protein [Haloimpatiens sp. FM7315]|uniref:LCP family protein n=1 Tax=Haloimpatiens sp. FM7315 TaxID=3298609 RepID=UPI00370A58B7